MHDVSATDPDFWRNRRVLLTGYSGFKGSWLWLWLERLGANLTGLALPPDAAPNLSDLLALGDRPGAATGDIRDRALVRALVERSDPEIVIHLAAQALVRQGYHAPLETFDVNVMGTLVLLDALRSAPSLRAVLIVTSDKVYANDNAGRRFDERDRLGGADPYSASKAACEIAVASFGRSFFAGMTASGNRVAVATARAGNVIGGGDWSADRIVPDLWRARRQGIPAILRNPDATRPWQHVLDPLCGYLAFARAMCEGPTVQSLNFGPSEATGLPVRDLAAAFGAAWPGGSDPAWVEDVDATRLPEAGTLAIDSRLARSVLGWRPRLDQTEAVEWTARWYAGHIAGEPMADFTLGQIAAYEERLTGKDSNAP